MADRRQSVRIAMMAALSVLLIGVMGVECAITFLPPPVVPPVVTTVQVELINVAPFTVDPGLFVDDVAHIVDPPLAPGDSVIFTTDCFADTTLLTQANLLDPAGIIASANDPLLTQGFEFVCGDTVTFVFTEDALGFFTQVLVNGTVIAP